MLASYETADGYYLNVRLHQIEFRRQRSLVELSAQVEDWYRATKEWRGDLPRYHTNMLGLQLQSSVQSMRELVENFHVQGLHLLCQANQWCAEEEPSNLEDAVVSFRARARMCMCLCRGLGALEIWSSTMKMREAELAVEEVRSPEYSNEDEMSVEYALLPD